MQDTVFSQKKQDFEVLKKLNLEPISVMGILNITPDSFYDGGRYANPSQILKQTEKMLSEGASIIDIGAVSTRPGAQELSIQEEEERLLPVLKLLKKEFPKALFSVDTYRAGIAKKAVNEGANIINDISGGSMDNTMLETIGSLNVPYILMHIQGTPGTMQQNPTYTDVVKEVYSYFEQKIKLLQQYGANQLIIDPGFGFGKTIEHNFTLLKNLNTFQNLGHPILAGLSRKSMIYKSLGITPKEALPGTIALNTIALQKGANILRVHDVQEAVQITRLLQI